MREGNYEFNFSKAISAKKFDDDSHGLSHCMKAVDFIVELKDKLLFIEVKEPQKDNSSMAKDFKSAKIGKELYYKYRDSYLYYYATDSINKPVYYCVIITLSLETSVLTRLTEQLQLKIPENPPAKCNWKKKIVSECQVFTIDSWHKIFPDFQIYRILTSK